MKFNPEVHHRQSVRLKEYDYSQEGACFVTICTYNRECLFGNIIDGIMVLNDAGWMVQTTWDELPIRFSNMNLDQFIVMPNYIHGIIDLHCRGESCIRPILRSLSTHTSHTSTHTPGDPDKTDCRDNIDKGDHKDRPYGTLPETLGRIVQAFKSITTHEYINGVKQSDWPHFPGKLWQRNYYEHIIRHENECQQVREYITNNPVKWALDRENPDADILIQSEKQAEPWQR